ncbi:NUDIX hydrolase [Mycoplasmatota bacterium]|nr:NUDIX hydrolase [Mycoplasmatota bacterium]
MILEVFADGLTKKDISKNSYHSSRAIIKDEDQVLLLYSKKLDYYMLPGGRIEKNESPEDCVVREVKEETGLDVIIENPTVLIKEYYEDSTWNSHFFLCKIKDSQQAQQNLTEEEHYLDIEIKWMPYLDALNLLDSHDSSFSKAYNIMQREFLALSNSL